MHVRFGLLLSVALLTLAACDDAAEGDDGSGGTGGGGGSATGGDGGSASGGDGGSASGGDGGSASGGAGGMATGGAGGMATGGAGGMATGGAGGMATGGAGGMATGGAGGMATGGAGGTAGPSCPDVCDYLVGCSGGGDAAECVLNCEADLAQRPVEVAACIECLLGSTCGEFQTGSCEVICGGPGPCPPGEALDANGDCRPSCASVEDCYALGGYCASDSLCYDAMPGSAGNDCAAALAAAPMDASGPLIFSPLQLDLGPAVESCRKDPGVCVNNGNVCGWSFSYFDPDGNVPATLGALYSKTFFVEDDGSELFVFDIDAPDVRNATATFYMCFDEVSTIVDGAVRLYDDTNLRSNALCVTGTAP